MSVRSVAVKDCPTHDQLMALEQGELDDAQSQQLAGHVHECPKCAATIAEIRNTDPDTQMLRLVFQKAGAELTLGSAGSTELTPIGGVPGKPMEQLPSRSPKAMNRSTESSANTTWNIPDYDRVALCGEGSYGAVWAVRDRVGVYRALKIIDKDRLERAKVKCYEQDALETYCRKVARHPYLVTVYHVGVVGRLLYYTMDLADDQRLHGPVSDPFPSDYRPLTLEVLIKGGRLRLDIAVEIMRRLLRGLATLHELELIHRDIKPSNIIFVNRYPKLADIGILTSQQGTGKLIGTPRYMPPDRARDKTADIYAMGVVLREMIEGTGHSSATQPFDSAKWDPDRIHAVIDRACAREAADRFPTAAEMLEDLEAAHYRTENSLFDELEALYVQPPPQKPSVAIQLAFALIHRIPWIAGLILLIYILSRL